MVNPEPNSSLLNNPELQDLNLEMSEVLKLDKSGLDGSIRRQKMETLSSRRNEVISKLVSEAEEHKSPEPEYQPSLKELPAKATYESLYAHHPEYETFVTEEGLTPSQQRSLGLVIGKVFANADTKAKEFMSISKKSADELVNIINNSKAYRAGFKGKGSKTVNLLAQASVILREISQLQEMKDQWN